MTDATTRTLTTLGSGPVAIDGVPDGTVLYDGVCVLCSAWFRFVAARDAALQFKFLQIQDELGRNLAAQIGIDPDEPQTNAVIIGGLAYLRSDAALQILTRLPGWSWTRIALLVPRWLRDAIYRPVARNRYRLFGRTETCLRPTDDLQAHIFQVPQSMMAEGGITRRSESRDQTKS